jgi:hypothetical protein
VDVAVTVDHLPVDGTMKGFFSWNIGLPVLGPGDSAELIYTMQGGPPVTKDLKTAPSGVEELDSGYYLVTILLTKNGKAAGRTEEAHIYPGLTTRAGVNRPDFTVFTDADFVDMKYLAGTAAVVKPGSLTLYPVYVKAYEDLACVIPIVTDPLSVIVSSGDKWSMKIPVTQGDVYLRLETSGGGRSFNAAAAHETGAPDNGRSGIALSMVIYALSQTITGPGSVGIDVAGQGAYAMEGETVALTVSPDPGCGLKPGTLLVKETSSGAPVTLSGSGGSYSFAMPAADVQITAEFASSAKELLSFTFGSWPGTVNESAKTVAVTVPYGTSISGIIPTATVSAGADYSPKEAWGSGVSGSTKTYTVTAEDGSSVDYAVTVTIAAAPVYSIVVTPSANGTVTPSSTGASAGETVTLTVSADPGYGLKPGTLLVKETTGGAPVTLSGSGASYSFAMPAANVTVTAEFEPVEYRDDITTYTALKNAIESSGAGVPRVYCLKAGTFVAGAVTTGITVENGKDISIIAEGAITIKRTGNFGVMFIVQGGATLNLGLPGMTGELVLDGGRGSGINATGALVSVSGGATVNMHDKVTLWGNNNSGQGGGANVGTSGTFNMKGGTIGGNGTNERNSASNGNGVYVGNSGAFAMSGSASLIGNGVHMSSNATSVSIEGEATVDPVNDQIYLETGKYVTLSGDLTGSAPAPRARIQPASLTNGIKVLGGEGTLVHDNKDMFVLYNGSTSYSGANYIRDNGVTENIP